MLEGLQIGINRREREARGFHMFKIGVSYKMLVCMYKRVLVIRIHELSDFSSMNAAIWPPLDLPFSFAFSKYCTWRFDLDCPDREYVQQAN